MRASAMAGRRRKTNRFSRWLREYTDGFTAADFRHLFDREAGEAFKVLARDRPAVAAQGPPKKLFQRLKIVFLGMSYKLSPARRMLFAGSLLAAVLGLAKASVVFNSERITVDFSPLWFSVAVAGLTFLLALELVDRIRVRDELEVARELQRDLLPRSAPAIPGYTIAHSYQTANEVGGDYYDFLLLPDGRVGLFVGDASGHGMAAGLLMAIANATLKLAVDLDPAPERVASLLNRVLFRTGDRRAFMSLFYGLLSPATGELTYVCAGHPFPLLRRSGGEISELGRGGLPLGVRPVLELATECVTIDPGGLLLLYTDGLPEATSRAGEVFGYTRIAELLARGGSCNAVHDRVLAAFHSLVGDEHLADDACVVVIARS